jgi:hypothetical protein
MQCDKYHKYDVIFIFYKLRFVVKKGTVPGTSLNWVNAVCQCKVEMFPILQKCFLSVACKLRIISPAHKLHFEIKGNP